MRDAVQGALTAQVAVGATPKAVASASTDQQIAADLSASAVDHRVDVVNNNASDTVTQDVIKGVDQAYAENLSADAPFDADYLNYTSAGFDIAKWDGIQVVADTATAFVEGNDHYLTVSGATRHDTVVQYQVTLNRSADSAHGWIVTKQTAIQLEG